MRPIPLPPKISLANLPTPLRHLSRLSKKLGGPDIWLKQDDLSEFALSGNKVRKLEFVIADALAQSADTLITCGGVQSNHCRATAIAAARLGLKCHLVLRGSSVESNDGNLLLDNLCGAEIAMYDTQNYTRNLNGLLSSWRDHYLAQNRTPYVIPTGASNGVGLCGYLSASIELFEQAGVKGFEPDIVVCASGSGGTQAGLTLGAHWLQPSTKVFGFAACDSCAYFDYKVRQDVTDWQRRYADLLDSEFIAKGECLADRLLINTIDEYIGPGYAGGYPELYETLQMVARTEGVVLDPVYTAKAFHGMLQEIKKGTFAGARSIVFVHTGGVFGLFPQRGHFINRAQDYF